MSTKCLDTFSGCSHTLLDLKGGGDSEICYSLTHHEMLYTFRQKKEEVVLYDLCEMAGEYSPPSYKCTSFDQCSTGIRETERETID